MPASHDGLQAVTVELPGSLAVPGRHEAVALTDMCPACQNYAQPTAVLDQERGGRSVSRVGVYRCATCQAAWLCWWSAPGSTRPRRTA